VITGGILGIVTMRMVIGQLLSLVRRYPAIVDGAFIIIAWVGFKLSIEYLHDAHFTTFEIPRWLSLVIIIVIFVMAFIYARMQGPAAVVPMAELDQVLDDDPLLDDVGKKSG
jgi:predicted tellurium resistance membrane protein TerC